LLSWRSPAGIPVSVAGDPVDPYAASVPVLEAKTVPLLGASVTIGAVFRLGCNDSQDRDIG